MPDMHSANYSPYGREGQSVWKQRLEYAPATWNQSFCMGQNAGGLSNQTWKSSPHSITPARGKSVRYSGPILFLTKTCTIKPISAVLRQILKGRDGVGLATYWGKKMSISPRLLCNGHLMVDAKEKGQMRPGAEWYNQRWKTLGKPERRLVKKAKDRQMWRVLVEALCADRHKEDEWVTWWINSEFMKIHEGMIFISKCFFMLVACKCKPCQCMYKFCLKFLPCRTIYSNTLTVLNQRKKFLGMKKIERQCMIMAYIGYLLKKFVIPEHTKFKLVKSIVFIFHMVHNRVR